MTESNRFRELLKRSPVGDAVRQLRAVSTLRRWQRSGRTTPPPPLYKQRTVKEYAEHFRISRFIETGTYMGDMVEAVRSRFQRITSIEIDDRLYQRARERFQKYRHITILHGDSANVLPTVLEQLDKPCLFWLDGHYSGGITGMGADVSPVLQEVQHILAHRIPEHVILIDDARLFRHEEGYPSLEELREIVESSGKQWRFNIKEDIIRIHL